MRTTSGLEASRIEGLFSHHPVTTLHGTKVVVWVRALKITRRSRHEHSSDTDRNHGAAELAILVAPHLVGRLMMRLFFQAGGAFEPWWWIPTVSAERLENQSPASTGKYRQCTNGPEGTSLALFHGKQGHAGTHTPFTIQQGGHHGRIYIGIFHG
jgi:hypothetical protein